MVPPRLTPLLALEGLTFGYSPSAPLFTNAAFSIAPGERVGLFSENGSGKTTLLRLLTGLEPLKTGTLCWKGAPVQTPDDFARLRRQAGFALQNADDQLFFPEVLEDVMFGPLNLGDAEARARDKALQALETLGIAHLAHAASFRLSGGQKRLVALAGILVMQPDLLLLDEPTTGLDMRAQARLLTVLQQQSCAMLVVSHHADFLCDIASRVVTIREGRFEETALPPMC